MGSAFFFFPFFFFFWACGRTYPCFISLSSAQEQDAALDLWVLDCLFLYNSQFTLCAMLTSFYSMLPQIIGYSGKVDSKWDQTIYTIHQ